MVAKFRKKPVIVEAVQYDGSNYAEIAGFAGEHCLVSRKTDDPVFIDTLEGQMRANVGDWIVKGVAGEFYPCKPGIFEMTYEPVEED